MNFDTMSAEELITVLGNVTKQLEKRVLTDMKHTRQQMEKLAQTIGLPLKAIPKARSKSKKKETKPETKGEEASAQKKEVYYRHPDDAGLPKDKARIWNGKTRKPKWLKDLLKEDRPLEDLKVTEMEAQETAPPSEETKEEPRPEEPVPEPETPSVLRF